MLSDEDLLRKKRALALSKPKKQNIGPLCPVCDVRDPPREHVARHFSDELMDYVSRLADQNQCGQCQYRGERAKNLGLHIALVHGQLVSTPYKSFYFVAEAPDKKARVFVP
jgi:hypothetical protein